MAETETMQKTEYKQETQEIAEYIEALDSTGKIFLLGIIRGYMLGHEDRAV